MIDRQRRSQSTIQAAFGEDEAIAEVALVFTTQNIDHGDQPNQATRLGDVTTLQA